MTEWTFNFKCSGNHTSNHGCYIIAKSFFFLLEFHHVHKHTYIHRINTDPEQFADYVLPNRIIFMFFLLVFDVFQTFPVLSELICVWLYRSHSSHAEDIPTRSAYPTLRASKYLQQEAMMVCTRVGGSSFRHNWKSIITGNCGTELTQWLI